MEFTPAIKQNEHFLFLSFPYDFLKHKELTFTLSRFQKMLTMKDRYKQGNLLLTKIGNDPHLEGPLLFP